MMKTHGLAAPDGAEPVVEYEDLFPAKLHYVLEQVEMGSSGSGGKVGDEFDPVIAWQPHGRAFLVRDRERFVQAYLPNWFRQTTWASFQRQLNHYEFKRITSGPDKNSYYHPCFVRDDRSLCKYIRRVKLKGNGPRKPSKPEDQPNFYQLPPSISVSGTQDNASVGAVHRPAGGQTPPGGGGGGGADPRPFTAIRRVSSATQCSLPFASATATAQTILPGTTTFVAAGSGPGPVRAAEHPPAGWSHPTSLLVMMRVPYGYPQPTGAGGGAAANYLVLPPGTMVGGPPFEPPSTTCAPIGFAAAPTAASTTTTVPLRPHIFQAASSSYEDRDDDAAVHGH